MPSSPDTPASGGFSLFAYGFRPFFLLAATYGVFSPTAWTIAYLWGLPFPGAEAPTLWHAHEMLFGFAAAAAAGFLLTAVPAWTGTPAPAGTPLVLLSLLWLGGRVVLWVADVLPAGIVAAADLLLIPALLLLVARPVVAAGKIRNVPVLLLVGLLFAGNVLYHAEALGWTADTARPGVLLATYAFVLLVVMISGRIIPAFTGNALRAAGSDIEVRTAPLAQKGAILFTLLALVGNLVALPAPVTGTAALAAAVALVWRMRFWHTAKTLDAPILWILHLAHAWLPIAFLLLGGAKIWAWPTEDAALHALTAGVIGTAIIAVMSRAGLGHTGRPLKAPPAVVAGYLCVTGAALLRVAGAIATDFLVPAFVGAGVLWSLAFALFVVVFIPILVRPRPDGQAG